MADDLLNLTGSPAQFEQLERKTRFNQRAGQLVDASLEYFEPARESPLLFRHERHAADRLIHALEISHGKRRIRGKVETRKKRAVEQSIKYPELRTAGNTGGNFARNPDAREKKKPCDQVEENDAGQYEKQNDGGAARQNHRVERYGKINCPEHASLRRQETIQQRINPEKQHEGGGDVPSFFSGGRHGKPAGSVEKPFPETSASVGKFPHLYTGILIFFTISSSTIAGVMPACLLSSVITRRCARSG